jgi:hypothetical protein
VSFVVDPEGLLSIMAARSSRTFMHRARHLRHLHRHRRLLIAVPVLPDLTRKLGASPTMVGLLFASFGVTALLTAIPMGVVSDRVGRKWPLVAGFVGLAIASVLLAFADGLPSLFMARLAQGAADAVTWVVGLALVADLRPGRARPRERHRDVGRELGVRHRSIDRRLVVHELGAFGCRSSPLRPCPRLAPWRRSGDAAVAADASRPGAHSVGPAGAGRRTHAVILAATTIVDAGAGAGVAPCRRLGINPGRIGLVFGIAAIAAAVLHPVRTTSRIGGVRAG